MSNIINSIYNYDGTKNELYSKVIADTIAQEFDSTKNYLTEDHVFYNTKLYKFLTNHSAGAWAGTDVVEVTVYEDINNKQNKLNIDNTPVINSTNPVSSGGVKTVLDNLSNQINAIQSSPLVATTASAMTNTNKIYVYTGNQSGYTSGNWYYYNGTAWTSGGVYNAIAINTDTSLSVTGQPADAKKVGDEISDLKDDLEQAQHEVIEKLLLVESANIYDKNSAQQGIAEVNGSKTANSNYYYSDYIKVTAGDVIRSYYENIGNHTIYTANMAKVCAYDTDKNAISASGQNTSATSYTVPEGIEYIEITLSNGTYETAVITKNDSTQPSTYIAYVPPYYIASTDFIDNAVRLYGFISGVVTKQDTDFWQRIRSANLFNKYNVVDGEYFNSNGIIGTSSFFFRSYVELDGSGTYNFKVAGDFFGLANAVKIPCYNKNKVYVKTINGTTSDSTASKLNECILSISEQDISDGVFYIGYSEKKSNIDSLMVVKSATYPSIYTSYYDRWTLPDLYINADTNPLTGKIAVFDGDSICAGLGSSMGDYGNGWAGRIGIINAMEYYNVGVSGACITAETYDGSTPRHWICRYIDTIHTNHPDADYVILEGGTNDADNFFNTPEKLGTFDEADFTGPFDDTTFYGAMDSLCKKALEYFPNAKIGFIVAQKMGLGLQSYTANRRAYFDHAKAVCKKWSIPVLDLWDEGKLRPDVTSMYNPTYNTIETATEHGLAYYDGQHLTAYGYDIISNMIAEWMKSL